MVLVPMVLGLAACSPDLPPSHMAEVPLRAPLSPVGPLMVALPGVASVPRALTSELTRGGPAVCAPLVNTVLVPAGEGRFQLLLEDPGYVVTRESVLRRTAAGPPDGPELALDGANNGRCDYLLRVAMRR